MSGSIAPGLFLYGVNDSSHGSTNHDMSLTGIGARQDEWPLGHRPYFYRSGQNECYRYQRKTIRQETRKVQHDQKHRLHGTRQAARLEYSAD